MRYKFNLKIFTPVFIAFLLFPASNSIAAQFMVTRVYGGKCINDFHVYVLYLKSLLSGDSGKLGLQQLKYPARIPPISPVPRPI